MAQLLYFAWVRERIGRSDEHITLPAHVTRIESLLDHLQSRGGGHAAALADRTQLRFAVNQKFAAPDAAITDADEIAIFPPVTGG